MTKKKGKGLSADDVARMIAAQEGFTHDRYGGVNANRVDITGSHGVTQADVKAAQNILRSLQRAGASQSAINEAKVAVMKARAAARRGGR